MRSNNGEHSEIALIGTKSCLIERGQGYQSIRGYEEEEMLEKEELCRHVSNVSILDRMEGNKRMHKNLFPYWKQPDRDEIVYAISGWWHKYSNIKQEFA